MPCGPRAPADARVAGAERQPQESGVVAPPRALRAQAPSLPRRPRDGPAPHRTTAAACARCRVRHRLPRSGAGASRAYRVRSGHRSEPVPSGQRRGHALRRAGDARVRRRVPRAPGRRELRRRHVEQFLRARLRCGRRALRAAAAAEAGRAAHHRGREPPEPRAAVRPPRAVSAADARRVRRPEVAVHQASGEAQPLRLPAARPGRGPENDVVVGSEAARAGRTSSWSKASPRASTRNTGFPARSIRCADRVS